MVPLALYNGCDLVKLSMRILTTVTYHATLFVLIWMPLSFFYFCNQQMGGVKCAWDNFLGKLAMYFRPEKCYLDECTILMTAIVSHINVIALCLFSYHLYSLDRN